MWFYYLLLVLLNIGLGYAAGRYYLQRQDDPAKTSNDEPLSPAVDSAGSNVARLIGDFREEMHSYRETLDTFDQQAVGYQTELNSQVIRDSVQSLQAANETHVSRQADLLGELRGEIDGSDRGEAITSRVEKAIDQEKWVLDAVGIELELSAAETDAEKGSGQLLEQTAALLSANNDFSDRLEVILSEFVTLQPSEMLREFEQHPADAESEGRSVELAQAEAVN